MNIKTKERYIKEIELNTCNSCGANCIMCSEPHGCGNIPYMKPDTFNILLEQLKDIKTDVIHTSGDGETFMNPHYLDYIRLLKQQLPNHPRMIYNNFSLMTRERADIIVKENLFTKIHTRVDSLIPWIFKKSSGLDMERVIDNICYFLSINDKIPFVVLYNNIKDYYNRCQSVLGKRPFRDRFSDVELEQVKNEQGQIMDYLKKYAKRPDLLIGCRINHGLWGERYRPDVIENRNHPCPKINVIKNVLWIYPDGRCGTCCYGDRQDNMITGDIHNEHILDIFYGETRRKYIGMIERHEITDDCCVNPRLCGFGDSVESK